MKLYRHFLYFLVLLISSCEVADYYLGYHLQPEFVDNEYEEGMNIFGIVRPGEKEGHNLSFVHVQQVLPAVGDTSSDLKLDSAIVFIHNIEDEFISRTFEFEYTWFDSTIFRIKQYRPTESFNPAAGEVYQLEGLYYDLPDVSSTTIVPNKPEIVEGSFSIQNNYATFTIEADTTFSLLEIRLVNNEPGYYMQRIVPDEKNPTTISFFIGGEHEGQIHIYGYDHNLATYYLTSNNSLNFNKYREAYRLVDGGYGVFGSLNYTIIEL